MQHVVGLVGLLVVIAIVVRSILPRLSNKLPLPPGPKQLPILGNTLQLQREYTWRQYLGWIKEFGPIFTLNVAGNTFIVLGSAAVAQDVLNKRSIVSSNRPRLPMANDLVTKGMHMLLRPYDAAYRLHQRMHATVLNAKAAATYAATYESQSVQLLHKLLADGPEPDFAHLFANYNLSVIYTLVYSKQILTGEEKCVADSRAVQQDFQKTMTPGAYIVDSIPVLNLLPRFLAPWKAEADRLYQAEATLHMSNMKMGRSTEAWNFTKQFSASSEAKNISEVELAYSLGILTNAGFDTLKIMLEWFLVACVTYPATMKQAQAAIDSAIGKDRLPVLADKDSIPYISAMVEETLRWRSILNGGFPHVTTEDDEYQGYRIPKGAVLLPHFWAIDHDEALYTDPDAFIPERWLTTEAVIGNEKEPKQTLLNSHIAAFGFGRRICTGRNIARNTLWVVVARLLWAFDIRNPLDVEGKEIAIDPLAMDPGINTKTPSFKVRFIPRGEWAEEVILKEWSKADQSKQSR